MGQYRKHTYERFLTPPTHAYSILLVSLMGLWLVSPFLDMVQAQRYSSTFFISVTLVAACYAMMDQGKSFIVVIVLGLVLMIMLWIDFGGQPSRSMLMATQGTALLFFGVVAYELLVDILAKETRVDRNLIAGAIAVYLLIGVCFAFVYELVFTFNPEAFRGVTAGPTHHNTFMYFSFVTMTTVGYGDITPVTRVGGSFATLEAIIGQLYLTVLVARLVGMHISQGPQELRGDR